MTHELYQPSRNEQTVLLPEGMLEHIVESDIHDLVRLHGFEKARELIAEYLNNECERKHHG